MASHHRLLPTSNLRVIALGITLIVFCIITFHKPHLANPQHIAAISSQYPNLQSSGVCTAPRSTTYTPDNLLQHKVPKWFEDAKLGVFIHWGLYSVPGWAVIHHTFGDKVSAHTMMTHNPYAEWYMNTMQLEGSPTQEYHNMTYGAMPYLGFVPMFNSMIRKWNPNTWAQFFQEIGAKYVVLTTKHHDGFTLWPSEIPNPHRKAEEQHIARDVVGELTQAVRDRDIEMGLYYSGGLDWSFDGVINPRTLHPNTPMTEEYAHYCDAHLYELMQKYRPAILWDDINYPSSSKPHRLLQIFTSYFNEYCPTGVVNDRWGMGPKYFGGDFGTPEYGRVNSVRASKWELCRGVGRSFGYNRNEGSKEMLTGAELIEMLVDVTAKNGNLLIDVGPDANGRISELQQKPLRELGKWLATNGEAIYGTRPFIRHGTPLESNVRYTTKHGQLYCIIAELPTQPSDPLIMAVRIQVGTAVTMLQSGSAIEWSPLSTGLGIELILPHQPSLLPFVIVMHHKTLPIRDAVRVLKP